MKRIVIILILTLSMTVCVHAADLSAPPPPSDALQLMPSDTDSFAKGILYILTEAVNAVSPDITEGARLCLSLVGASMLIHVLHSFQVGSKNVVSMAGILVLSGIVLSSIHGLINEGAQTVSELSEYGKLLIPVLTSAMASQGGVSSATSIYTTTIIADGILTALIGKILVPGIYIFLALSVANSMSGQEILQKLKTYASWITGWILKSALYVFTGYMTISGVITGTVDQSALKATKLTIAGMVPVVGGILSDASEAVLIGAGMVKNAAGIYGLLAVVAIAIEPFLRIGIHYLMLKLTAAICAMFLEKESAELIRDFASAMGFLLAMTGCICVILIISVVCFMKGMS